MSSRYTIGLDFGTSSVRALVADVATGRELATAMWDYRRGQAGVVVDPKDPFLARQDPADYVAGTEAVVKQTLRQAARRDGFSPGHVIGIGVDTTGSTPFPVGKKGEPLAFKARFRKDPNALAWLWKDHTGHAEAEEITEVASRLRPHYLAKCGGKYSSEWFWSKLLHCLRAAPEVVDAAHSWVEIADWIPAVLTGTTRPDLLKRGICAAGHKAMFNPAWGGYPDEEFIGALDARLVRLRRTLPDRAYTVADSAGGLTKAWARKLGLRPGVPVAIGAFDAHLGGVGSGIAPGMLVKIMGTSTCDMMVSPLDEPLADIPGLCGIVPESILPHYHGLEAGQSAVGDIYNWFVNCMAPGGKVKGSHASLTGEAERLRPGQCGLLGLDWQNGNRTVLVDQRLTGLLVGMTLHTTPGEAYRAPDRVHRLRRAGDHGTVRGVRPEGAARGQLRRHLRQEPPRHADPCRRDGADDGGLPEHADLRAGRGDGGSGCGRARGRRARRLRRSYRGHDRRAGAQVRAGPRGRARLRPALPTLPPPARHVRHQRPSGQPV